MTGQEIVVPAMVVDGEPVAEVAVTDRAPVAGAGARVVDGELVTLAPYRSPLAGLPGWTGGPVADPAEIDAIRTRVGYGRLPWWRRALTPPPPGWRPTRCGTCRGLLYTDGACPNCDRPRRKELAA